ncbi:conjugal transfer protein TraF [Vibrio coralliilyticus]|uniref:conjugal transfer protein TraF n=1 Tax=Vibrio coralliilyticus TaxID=190893 RepID=UPI0006CC5C38|nr:conjugal transfer protein TraF [Vibrio coralliilyticus]AXN34571.1 conjugal transfer protein TraF [Vibrio coralliilyticus]AXN34839.1 conjugal transfer protein TraF [Vibrio coralliilyticus]KPH24972.1 conjugal transfer protein TraF [Vibrio coralliilyticus]
MRILVCLILLCSPRLGAEPLGWRWYNGPRVTSELPAPKPAPSLSPRAQLRWFHQYYKTALAQATLAPDNLEHALTLMRLHHFILTKTEHTAATFLRVLTHHPELSTVIAHPMAHTARKIYYERQAQTQTRALTTLSQQGWGLFWLYRGADPYTQALAPSLQTLADRYELALLGISEDGILAPAVRRNRRHRGQLNVNTTPALMLVQPATGHIEPVAYGFLSTSELTRRLYHVATEFRHVTR